MYFGWPPFYDKNKKYMLRKILSGRLKFTNRNNKINESAKDVIRGFLEREPEDRLGIKGNGFLDVQSHKFFEGMSWELLFERKIDPPFKPKIKSMTNNFDAEFTDQSARISEHEKRESAADHMDEEEDVFEDFKFTRESSPDAFWEA